MSGYHLPSGIGASTGDALVVNENLYLGATTVIYVDSTDGDDANDGLSRYRPKLTLSAAITASVAYSFIVLINEYDEEIGSQLTFSKAGVCVIGEGSSSGTPDCTIGFNGSGELDVTAEGVEFRNITFGARSADGSVQRILVGTGAEANGFRMIGCRVECGANDDEAGVYLLNGNSDHCLFKNTTFVVTSTTTRPDEGLRAVGSQFLQLENVTFDGGTVGWGTYALDASSSEIRVKGQEVSLLRGSVLKVHADSDGWIQVGTTSGGGRVEW